MNVEILMSTMNQTDLSLVDRAKINTDAVIINQTDHYAYHRMDDSENKIEMYNLAERGIGKSRNKALMASEADICLLADDDVTYKEDYAEKIVTEFKNYPEADIIIFDYDILEKEGYRSYQNQNKKLNPFNFMKHGGPKIAFRRESILRKNIFFSLLFGGGARYGSGEDTLFLKEAMDAGLKLYESAENIGEIDNRESSWFSGYNEKYFYDKGALYKALHPRIWPLMCLQHILRHHRQDGQMTQHLQQMFQGAKEY